MKTCTTLLGLAILLSLASAGLAADVPPEEVIEALIEQLGSASYQKREEATQSLWQIGDPAVKALQKAAKSDDPEVRIRAQEILKGVQLGIRPDWPTDLIQQVKNLDQLNDSERRRVLQQITDRLKDKALPLLLRRMAVGSPHEAAYALNQLQKMGNEHQNH